MNESFAFAHEAPVFFPDTNEVTFASNDGGPLGMSDLDHNNQVAKISLDDPQIAKGGMVTVTKVWYSLFVQFVIFHIYSVTSFRFQMTSR